MKKEIKICMPYYKIAYTFFFIAILSLIRGVVFTSEIGLALEPPMALLAAVVCSDAYVQEIVSKRSEVQRLYPMRNRMASVFQRIVIQEGYLLVLAAAGYGMFYLIQRPRFFYDAELAAAEELRQFLIYLAAIAITLFFWGMLSHTLACLFRNMWAGIGGCLILWIMTNSTGGDKALGKWNVFSYTFRNIEDTGDFSWVCGKIICMVCCIVMAAALPKIIRKRG